MATTILYELIDSVPGSVTNGKAFYVGIGRKRRPFEHLRAAKSRDGHHNWRLQIALDAHFALGITPGIVVVADFPTRAAAIKAEREAIKRYGRDGIDPAGILLNLSAGGGAGPAIQTEEVRTKIGEMTLIALSDPSVRARHLAALMRINAEMTPEMRSDAAKRRSPESIAKSVAALVKTYTDPIIQAKRAENSREPARTSWCDPTIRAKRVAGMRGKRKTMTPEAIAARRANAEKARTPEALERQREAMAAARQTEEFRAAKSEGHRGAWADPEKRANMLKGRSAGISNSWSDPDVRARRIAGIKAAAEARRLKREAEH